MSQSAYIPPGSRRQFIKLAAASAIAGGTVSPAPALAASTVLAPPKRALRVAHLTDSHIQPERDGHLGLAACLKHVHDTSKPDLILTGGDNIMDAFSKTESRAAELFSLWKKVVADHTDIPMLHCVGNHDVWGWDKKDSATTGTEGRWGKKWAVETYDLPRSYYAFDRAGWHFIVLDSTFPHGGDGYTAKLDEDQFAWLAADLAATPATKPVLILSHIPILSACAYFDGENEEKGDWNVPGSWMHIDARRIKDLFFKHPNVKVALSGHIHLVDRVDYLGVTYLCNGAVSAGWWKGPNQECLNGYGVVDLFTDGSFDESYETFDWDPRE